MTKEEALWGKMGENFEQGSSLEEVFYIAVPSARELAHLEAGPSGHHLEEEEVDSDDIKVVYTEVFKSQRVCQE